MSRRGLFLFFVVVAVTAAFAGEGWTRPVSAAVRAQAGGSPASGASRPASAAGWMGDWAHVKAPRALAATAGKPPAPAPPCATHCSPPASPAATTTTTTPHRAVAAVARVTTTTAKPVAAPPATPRAQVRTTAPAPAHSASPAASASGYGCGAAIAYLEGHAAPGFSFACPAYAFGGQAMTCWNRPGMCPGTKVIAIADPCPAAYMNEAWNSWVVLHLRSGPIDPYGYCRN